MQRHFHNRRKDNIILGQKIPKDLASSLKITILLPLTKVVDVFPLIPNISCILHLLSSAFTNTLHSECNYLPKYLLFENLSLSNLTIVNFSKWDIQALNCLPTQGILHQNLKGCITTCLLPTVIFNYK